MKTESESYICQCFLDHSYEDLERFAQEMVKHRGGDVTPVNTARFLHELLGYVHTSLKAREEALK